jgi:hypothetical protein
MPAGYQLVFRLKDNRVIAPDKAARRRLARSFVEIGDRYGLLAFRVVDNHAHATHVCSREEVGRAAQAIGSSITQALGLDEGFNITYVKPLADQRHLEESFRYVVGNADKHGATSDPLHDASIVPDLLRMRLLGSEVIDRVVAHLPAESKATVRRHLPVLKLEPAFALEHLADAAAAALALPHLRGRTDAHAMARAAAVRLAAGKVAVEELSRALGCHRSTLTRSAEVEIPAGLLDAVRLGMGLRVALGDRLTPTLPESPPPERRVSSRAKGGQVA